MRYLITTLTLLLLITPLQVLAVEVVCEGDYEILSMEQMQHLQSCNKITGDLNIGKFGHESDITSLKHLAQLKKIGGYLYIQHNKNLTSLAGIDNLTQLGAFLCISQNSSLRTISSLHQLTSLGGGLAIYSNAQLSNLSGLENITKVSEHVLIKDHDNLTSLAGLNGINSISGNAKSLNRFTRTTT